MEQDATRFAQKNWALMVCKLALAEHPESKNMTGARDASEMEVQLMRTDLCKLISVCALPEATGTWHAPRWHKPPNLFVHQRHSPNQQANGQPSPRSLALFAFYQHLQRPFTSANRRSKFPSFRHKAISLPEWYIILKLPGTIKRKVLEPLLYWRLSRAPIHKPPEDKSNSPL